MARRVGDPDAMTSTLNARRWALSGPEAIDERLAVATELVRAAERAGDKELALQGHLWALVDQLELGNIPAVDVEIEAYGQLAAELRQPLYRWGAIIVRVMRAALAGQLRRGRASGRGRRGSRVSTAWPTTPRSSSAATCSCWPRISAGSRRRPSGWSGLVGEVSGRAAVAVRVASTPTACSAATPAPARSSRVLAVDNFAGIASDQLWLCNTALLAEVCDYLGDVARGRARCTSSCCRTRGRNIVVGRGGYALGSTSRYLGMLASLMCRYDEAEDHFERALEMNRRMRATPWIAHTRHDYARLLVGATSLAMSIGPTRLLADALTTARELGMRTLVAKIAGLRLEARGVSDRQHVNDPRGVDRRSSASVPTSAARRARRHGDDHVLRHRGLDPDDRPPRRSALDGGPGRSTTRSCGARSRPRRASRSSRPATGSWWPSPARAGRSRCRDRDPAGAGYVQRHQPRRADPGAHRAAHRRGHSRRTTTSTAAT